MRWSTWVYRMRLTRAMPVVLLSCAAILGLYFRVTYEATALSSLRQHEINDAAQILYRRSQAIDYALAQANLPQVQAAVSAFATDVTYEHVFLADENDKVVAALHLRNRNKSLANVVPQLCCFAELASFKDTVNELQYAGESIVRLSPDGQHLFGLARVRTDVAVDALRPRQSGILYVQRDLGVLYAGARRDAQQRALEIFFVGALLAVLTWMFFHFGFTRVIARLQTTADRLAAGNLNARTAVRNGRSELGRLSEAFDAMAAALQWREIERGHSEKALRQSEAEARAIAEQSPVGIFMALTDGSPRYANRAVYELLALPLDLSSSPNWLQYVHRDDKARVMSEWQRFISESHNNFDVECRVTAADGQERWVHAVASTIRDGNAGTGQVGTLLDMTVARRLNRAIEAAAAPFAENERFFQQLLKRLAQLTEARCAYIGVLDSDAAEFVRIHTLWLDGAVREGARYLLKGTPCASVLQSASTFCPSGVREKFPDHVLLREMKMESYLGVALRDAHEQAFGVLAIVDDKVMVERPEILSALQICAARVAAEVLREQANLRQQNIKTELERCVAERTAQLEAANKELEAFSYSVSHDLRAPLRGIDGFSQALLEDAADKLTGSDRDYLARIRAAAQRMGYLIDDLLKLSRVTRQEMSVQSVDLSRLVADIAAELKTQSVEREVEWIIAENMHAIADAALLRVAMMNLLENAYKYTSKTANARIECGQREQDGVVVYFVKDNGAGFDMRHAGRLFTAFQRLHLAEEFPGTGIGLATVARVIHRHGGIVWVEAAEGKGATFYFTLHTQAASVIAARQAG